MLPEREPRKLPEPQSSYLLRGVIAVLAGLVIAVSGAPQSLAQAAASCNGSPRKINGCKD